MGDASHLLPADLSSFPNKLPIYFRAPFLVVFVWGLWGVNVLVFNNFNINYSALLGYSKNNILKPYEIWRSCTVMLVFLFIFFAGYKLKRPFSDVLITPMAMYIIALGLLLQPFNVMYRTTRFSLLHMLKRVIFPASTGVTFAEVVTGDILTSLCKVLGDLAVTFCILSTHVLYLQSNEVQIYDHQQQLYSSGRTPAHTLATAAWADSWVRPIMISVPFILRFRQCLLSYKLTRQAFPHLLNCLKYLSSLPVIWISACMHHFPWMNTREMHRMWLLAVAVNSFYAFIWDIFMDWGLCTGGKYLFLRDELLFVNRKTQTSPVDSKVSSERTKAVVPVVYYVAICVDFFLRILWSFKLSSQLQLTREGTTFVLELFEVVRRFLWLFFRIEWESIKTAEFEPEEMEPARSDGFELVSKWEQIESLGQQPHGLAANATSLSNPIRSRTISDRESRQIRTVPG